ncbi:hypothetical protein GDO86_011293 [Hymenochirus boettgeri]|uniref:Uncharacterized protein n=1 Tax=Hymenochirus boettgeri TaxID=247094 RepID=A0A8T2JB62_9PIPI|nr:hypothetical protein GDO86_011293 [Hymenochirus boettgeri]
MLKKNKIVTLILVTLMYNFYPHWLYTKEQTLKFVDIPFYHLHSPLISSKTSNNTCFYQLITSCKSHSDYVTRGAVSKSESAG